MKTTLLSFLVLLASLVACYAPTTTGPNVTLAWDQSPDPGVNRYNLYWSEQAGLWTNVTQVLGRANTTCTLTNLTRGTTWWFTATCVTTNGLESTYATPVYYVTIPIPPPPQNLTITATKP